MAEAEVSYPVNAWCCFDVCLTLFERYTERYVRCTITFSNLFLTNESLSCLNDLKYSRISSSSCTPW